MGAASNSRTSGGSSVDQRGSRQEERGGDRRSKAQVMALEAAVVRQNLRGREAYGGGAQRMRIAAEQHRREPDAQSTKRASQLQVKIARLEFNARATGRRG